MEMEKIKQSRADDVDRAYIALVVSRWRRSGARGRGAAHVAIRERMSARMGESIGRRGLIGPPASGRGRKERDGKMHRRPR